MNTDDRALADLIAELRGLLAKATEPGPPAGLVEHDSAQRPMCSTNAMVWCDYHDRRQKAANAIVNALPTLLDRLEAFHAKPDRDDIERDVRIAIWNAGMKGGMGQDLSQAFIGRAMAEPTMIRALCALQSEHAKPVVGEREAVARAHAQHSGVEPWWWGEAFDDSTDEIAAHNRERDLLAADDILAALQSPPPVVSGEAKLIEAADYLISLYERLWKGGVVRDLAEAKVAYANAKTNIEGVDQ